MKIKYFSEILNQSFDSEKELTLAEKRQEKRAAKEAADKQKASDRRNYLIVNLENFHDLPRLLEEATKNDRKKWNGEKLNPITKASVSNIRIEPIIFRSKEKDWFRRYPYKFDVGKTYYEVTFNLTYKGSGFLSDYDIAGIESGSGNGGDFYSQQCYLFISNFPKLNKKHEKWIAECEKYDNYIKNKREIRNHSLSAKDAALAKNARLQFILKEIEKLEREASQIKEDTRNHYISIEKHIPEVKEPPKFF